MHRENRCRRLARVEAGRGGTRERESWKGGGGYGGGAVAGVPRLTYASSCHRCRSSRAWAPATQAGAAQGGMRAGIAYSSRLGPTVRDTERTRMRDLCTARGCAVRVPGAHARPPATPARPAPPPLPCCTLPLHGTARRRAGNGRVVQRRGSGHGMSRLSARAAASGAVRRGPVGWLVAVSGARVPSPIDHATAKVA